MQVKNTACALYSDPGQNYNDPGQNVRLEHELVETKVALI